MTVRRLLLLLSLTLITLSQSAVAAVNSQMIKASVDRFMSDYIAQLSSSYDADTRIDYRIRNLDPRLAMADCPQPLVTELKSTNPIGNINIRVSCQQQRPWSLYVPVEVDVYRQIVTAAIPIARGLQLQASQLQLREINVNQLNGSYFTTIDAVVGLQAKRPFAADAAMIANYLEPPVLIKKGETVTVTAKSGGLTVNIRGEALTDGHQGEQISVRNNQSKRVIEAYVTAQGELIIPM